MHSPSPDTPPAPATVAGPVARRRPRQARSKTRVEAILEVALALVVEQGAEALAMREVARRAGVQISSIYQYFPSKAAIIRALATRNLERVHLLLRREVHQLLMAREAMPTPAQAVHRVVDVYFAHYRDHPEAVAVWAGAQADPGLRALDAQDNRRTAEFLAPALAQILSLPGSEEVFPLALLLADVTGAAARLALSVASPLREQLMAHHKAMLIAALEATQRSGPARPSP